MNLPLHLRKVALNKVSDESLQHVNDVNEDINTAFTIDLNLYKYNNKWIIVSNECIYH